MDRRGAGLPEPVKDADHVRQDVAPVIGGRQTADPAVEHLHQLGAGFNLGEQVLEDQPRKARHERLPESRFRVHHRLGGQEVTRRLSLDQVAGQREGGARESDHGDRRIELAAEQLDRLQHEGHGLASGSHLQPIYICLAADRVLDHGPDPVHQLQLHAQPKGDRQHDVGEEHGAVDAKPPHRLQRDLGAELWVLTDGEEVVGLADLPVLGQ